MSAVHRPQVPATVSTLEVVTSEAPDFNLPLFRHYPAMKLGEWEAVGFFSRLLADQAERILVDMGAPSDSWMITGPPYVNARSAANLLALEVRRILGARGRDIALHELRLAPRVAGFRDNEEFDLMCNYSRNGLEKRMAMRSQVEQRLETIHLAHHAGGRRVMVINDINVTGTTQAYLQDALAAAGALSCHWLYIFEVEPSLGLRCPQIEYRINNSRLQAPVDFAQLLSAPETQPTARCLSRLMGMPIDELAALVQLLDPPLRRYLHEMVSQEGCYVGAQFSEKLACLTVPDGGDRVPS